MRTSLTELTPEQIAALPRVTRWRARKRGWVALDYHRGRRRWSPAKRDDDILEEYFSWAELYKMAARTWRSVCRYRSFPAWFSRNDFLQECVIAAWKNAHKLRGARNPEALIRHIMRIDGAKSTFRHWERALKNRDSSRFYAIKKYEGDMEWVRAMLTFCRSKLTGREYEKLEQFVFGERRRLPEGLKHKLHRIFRQEEKCGCQVKRK